MSRINLRTLAIGVALAVALLAAYSNHFHNAFHFDDFHAVVNNPAIRDFRNVTKFLSLIHI